MKRKIDVFSYAETILRELQRGILVTAKSGDKVNPMTIAWGTLGIEWGKPLFTVFVRESRFTKQLLDQNPEFTINVPLGDPAKKILGVCGTKSGRDIDKVTELNLTLEEPEVISVPGIRELPLTLECKIIYKQDQDPAAIGKEETDRFYQPDENNTFPFVGPKGDYHTAYYGEIVAAYIIEP